MTEESEMSPEEITFCNVACCLRTCLAYKLEKVKKEFPDIPEEPYRRVAYVSGFNEEKRAKLKTALAEYSETLIDIDNFFCDPIVQKIGSKTTDGEREELELSIYHSCIANDWKSKLQEAGVQHIDRWWRDIVRVSNLRGPLREHHNQFMSHYIEGTSALSLKMCGFDVQMKPYGEEGPDLQISKGDLTFDVEVSLFRADPDKELEECMARSKHMVEMPDKSHNISSKIFVDKLKQLRKDKNGIVLLNSNSIAKDYIEFEKLRECISEKSPSHLCAVIFNGRYILNQHARIPADVLDPALWKIAECLRRQDVTFCSKFKCPPFES